MVFFLKQPLYYLTHLPPESSKEGWHTKHWFVGPYTIHLSTTFETHLPSTESSYSCLQAKQIFLLGSQSLQKSGHVRARPIRSRRKAGVNLLRIILWLICIYYIEHWADDLIKILISACFMLNGCNWPNIWAWGSRKAEKREGQNWNSFKSGKTARKNRRMECSVVAYCISIWL
jgi:hypothetical protein